MHLSFLNKNISAAWGNEMIWMLFAHPFHVNTKVCVSLVQGLLSKLKASYAPWCSYFYLNSVYAWLQEGLGITSFHNWNPPASLTPYCYFSTSFGHFGNKYNAGLFLGVPLRFSKPFLSWLLLGSTDTIIDWKRKIELSKSVCWVWKYYFCPWMPIKLGFKSSPYGNKYTSAQTPEITFTRIGLGFLAANMLVNLRCKNYNYPNSNLLWQGWTNQNLIRWKVVMKTLNSLRTPLSVECFQRFVPWPSK